MTTRFGEATAATRREIGTYDVDLDPTWAIGTKLHGGYLLAVLAATCRDAAPPAHPHVTAIAASFIAGPNAGPAVVHVDLLRRGRSVSQLRAQLRQDDALCVEALVTQGRLDDADPTWAALPPPQIPPEAECMLLPRAAPGVPLDVPLMDAVDVRIPTDMLRWVFSEPTRRGVVAGWQRLGDGSDWEPASLLVALDAAPPVSFDLGFPGWTPTIQFSAYIRRLPAPGPLTFRLHASDVTGDRMDETAHAWDSKGRLVAQATQLAGVRPG